MTNFGSSAIAYLENTTWEQFSETYLGVTALFDEGEIYEAQKLVAVARSNFPLANVRPKDGEERSTQITQMLNLKRYPKDVREEVGQVYFRKHPQERK